MDLEQAIAAEIGSRQVLSDPELMAGYERDWTGRFDGRARLVARPGNAAEVTAVMSVCAEHGAAVVPQGGNTGLVGGGVPRDGEVVISLRRLDQISEVDAAVGQVTAGAGVTLAALQAAARAAGHDAALDFGARDACTMGGAVACDAGGARTVRYGTARARVAGLEAVMADGSLLTRLAGLPKDNAGYDLPQLLIGSEGTLGIVTAVRWRLEPLFSTRAAALIPLERTSDAAELFERLRASTPSLESCDFFLHEGLELVLAHLRRSSPLAQAAPFYVIAECAGADATEELAAALESIGVEEALIADDTASRERLWALRDGLTEAINAAGIPHKLDVGVPLARLAEFLERVPEAARAAGGGRTILFGHLGDGNVHVNVLGAEPDDTGLDDAVLELVLACEGTISAEHGVGVAKARWLARARGKAEVEAMRAIKRALDPHGLLNPGVVFPAE